MFKNFKWGRQVRTRNDCLKHLCTYCLLNLWQKYIMKKKNLASEIYTVQTSYAKLECLLNKHNVRKYQLFIYINI